MKKISLLVSICLILFSCEIKLKDEVDKKTQKESRNKETSSSVFLNPEITKTFLLGKFDYKKDSRFIIVDSKYTGNQNTYLQQKTYNAFIKMAEAAKADGINLARVIFIDSDTYSSSKEALDYSISTIQTGTYVVLDDFFSYKGDENKGVAKAFNEFLEIGNFSARRVLDYGMGGSVFVISKT